MEPTAKQAFKKAHRDLQEDVVPSAERVLTRKANLGQGVKNMYSSIPISSTECFPLFLYSVHTVWGIVTEVLSTSHQHGK